jgi:predicted CXXCH cytochrome family protein
LDGQTQSKAPQNFKEWLHQKRRHLAVGKKYSFRQKIISSIYPLSIFFWYVALVGFLINGFYEVLGIELFRQLLFFSIFLVVSTLLVEVRGSYEDEKESLLCLECHRESFDEDLLKGLIHQPCLEGGCIACHCSQAVEPSAGSAGMETESESSQPVEVEIKEPEINLIHVHLHSDIAHSFIFSEDKVDRVLLVELWLGKALQKVERVALLPLGQLPLLVDDKRPPQISDVQIEKVERGLSSTAVITWKTDKPATSEIRYGIDELDRHSFPHGCLVRNHRLTLPSLKTNRQYHFSVVSNDFFANQAVSDVLLLSTKKGFLKESESQPDVRNFAIVKKEFFNADGRYLALFEVSQSASLSIGGEGMQAPIRRLPDAFTTISTSKFEESSEAASGDQVDEHRYLFGEVETTIDNCFTCHKNIRKEMSHPVNVLPTPGMSVPKEYPLLSNGRMSCMTCHVRHAGENLFRLRAQGKKLCEGCHAAY